jgi:predicted dehydrogenase
MGHGIEHWHPNQDFFSKPGGGPVLDMGPCYLTNLVQLIGPAKRVAALSAIPSRERTIGTGPRSGEKITVETPTTIHALIEFQNGAVVTLNASWDLWKHGHRPMELYGSEGTLIVPDPNFLGGAVLVTNRAGGYIEDPAWDHPFAVPTASHRPARSPTVAWRG